MRFIGTTLVLGLACLGAGAQEKQEYRLTRDIPLTGSRLLATGAKGTVPFDKPYAELTPAQQAGLKAVYESMGDGDEPPYPLHGTRHLWRSLIDAGDRYGEHGPLSIIVDVAADGTATQVAVMKTPGKRLATHMSLVLLKERYKPALCAGTPCAQQFRFVAEWIEQP